jgi:hypothetical protein
MGDLSPLKFCTSNEMPPVVTCEVKLAPTLPLMFMPQLMLPVVVATSTVTLPLIIPERITFATIEPVVEARVTPKLREAEVPFQMNSTLPVVVETETLFLNSTALVRLVLTLPVVLRRVKFWKTSGFACASVSRVIEPTEVFALTFRIADRSTYRLQVTLRLKESGQISVRVTWEVTVRVLPEVEFVNVTSTGLAFDPKKPVEPVMFMSSLTS